MEDQTITMTFCQCQFLNRVGLLATPWTVPTRLLCLWNSPSKNTGLAFSSPGNLLNPGIEPGSPALQTNSLLSEPPGKPKTFWLILIFRDFCQSSAQIIYCCLLFLVPRGKHTVCLNKVKMRTYCTEKMYFCLYLPPGLKKKLFQFSTYLVFLPSLNNHCKILWNHKVYYDFTTNINLQGSSILLQIWQGFFSCKKRCLEII